MNFSAILYSSPSILLSNWIHLHWCLFLPTTNIFIASLLNHADSSRSLSSINVLFAFWPCQQLYLSVFRTVWNLLPPLFQESSIVFLTNCIYCFFLIGSCLYNVPVIVAISWFANIVMYVQPTFHFVCYKFSFSSLENIFLGISF